MKNNIIIKRVISILCLLSVVLSLGSCGYLYGVDTTYECNVDEVESINIVRFDSFDKKEKRFELTILSEVFEVNAFVNRLIEIDNYPNFGTPYIIQEGYVVIQINYKNGDFELVYHNVQITNNSGVLNSTGFLFDIEEFDSLISAYL